jgi:hypothetical protein
MGVENIVLDANGTRHICSRSLNFDPMASRSHHLPLIGQASSVC